MIARLQAIWTICLLLIAAFWLVFALPRSPVWAVGGLAFAALLYLAVMALQFTLMQRVNAADPAPRARFPQVRRAWWAELGVALRVFCWEQPFRSRAEPDWLPTAPTGQRGVVLVHGFLCNRALWRLWFAPLRAAGHAYEAVNLEPVFGSIDDYAPRIEDAVTRLLAHTGASRVALVGHSMGGLAIRAWLRRVPPDQLKRVARIITLGSPHQGTRITHSAPSQNGQQMLFQSDWVQALGHGEDAARRALMHIALNLNDNICIPQRQQVLPGVPVTEFRGIGHLEMCLNPRVIDWTCQQLASLVPAGAQA